VLGIVTAVIQKHPEVLNHGSGELPRRLFARILTLLTLSIRCVHPPRLRTCLACAVCWATPRAGLGGRHARRLFCRLGLNQSGANSAVCRLALPSSEAVDAVLDTLQAVTTLVGAARREHFCCVFAGAVELCEGTLRVCSPLPATCGRSADAAASHTQTWVLRCRCC
jgi:hypothetical protein